MGLDESLGPPLQPGRLLEILSRHGVDFVVIGGLAGSAHGSAYPTFDLDVAYARDKANLERLVVALEEMGVSLRGAPADLPFLLDARTLANGANFTFNSAFGRFDILGDVEGIRDYESLRSAARIETIDGVAVRVASIDHLIAMKRIANRPKDRMAVEEYIVIADGQKKWARGKKERGEG
jgi:ASC-1-like (ASCH) protein